MCPQTFSSLFLAKHALRAFAQWRIIYLNLKVRILFKGFACSQGLNLEELVLFKVRLYGWPMGGAQTEEGPGRQHEGVKPARQQEWCSPKRLLFHQVLRWLANVMVLCQLTEVRGDIIQLRHVEWGERVVPFYILARFFTSWCKKQIFFSGEILIIFSFLLYFQSKLKYGFYV